MRKFLLLLFLWGASAAPTSLDPKKFSCDNIQHSDSWRYINMKCKDEKVIKSHDDFILDVSREEPEDISAFFENKEVIGVGVKIINHTSFHKQKIRKLSFPKLRQIVIDHNNGVFEISENDALKTIEMPVLENVSIPYGTFSIFRNRNLTNFTLPQDRKLPRLSKHILVSGNNLLNKDDIEVASRIFWEYNGKGSHIQEQGECSFYQKPDHDLPKDKIVGIQHLSELDGCKYVYGNLLFSEGAEGDRTTAKLKNITGCVEIKNTKLKQLDFLDGTYITCSSWIKIVDNPYVENCNFKPIVAFDKRNLNFTNNCQGTCMPGETMYKDKQCEFVKEDIIITEKNKMYEFERLKKARVVEGVISVTDTIVQDLNWFANVEVINATLARSPVIDITKNKALKRIDFFALKNMTYPPNLKVVIRIKDNKDYAVSEDLYQHLLKLVGDKQGVIEVDRQELVEKKQMEMEEKEQEKKDSMNVKIGIGVGIPAGVVLLVGVVVGATLIGIRTRKSKGKKNNSDKKNGKGKKDVEKGGKNKVHPTETVASGAKVADIGPQTASVVVNMDENEVPNENRSDAQRPKIDPEKALASNYEPVGPNAKAASKYKSVMPKTKSIAPANDAPEAPKADDEYEVVNAESTVKPTTVKAVTAATILKSKAKGPSNYASVNVNTKAPTTKAVTAPMISKAKMDENYVVIPKSEE